MRQKIAKPKKPELIKRDTSAALTLEVALFAFVLSISMFIVLLWLNPEFASEFVEEGIRANVAHSAQPRDALLALRVSVELLPPPETRSDALCSRRELREEDVSYDLCVFGKGVHQQTRRPCITKEQLTRRVVNALAQTAL